MNAESNIRATNNLRIWEDLSRTDPRHTKPFKRSGGFSGTALKPIWIVKRLTEQFGPCGEGWGINEPTFQIVPGFNNEVLVYCTVRCWHGDPERGFFGVGGDKIVTHIKANEKYNRAERWENDDEAFKKAFTDAVNNAFKFVGVGADIHMGQFEDSKYVAATAQEFEEVEREAAESAPAKVPGISKIKERLNKLMLVGNADITLEKFNALVHDNAADLATIRDAKHDYWTGDPDYQEGSAGHEGFKRWIIRRRAELATPEESVSYQLLVSTLAEVETKMGLQEWLRKNGDVVESLDGEESRKFEQFYSARESAIAAMDLASV